MKGPIASALILALTAALNAQAPPADQDVLLRAMTQELERSRALRVVDLDKPYYIEYAIEDADVFTASASLGSLIAANRTRARIPQIQVRAGDYAFDNTNHVYSAYYSGSRYDPDQWPLDNNYGLLRQCFWLATDRAYKTAVEGLSRKRAALKNAAAAQSLPDFSKADAVRIIQPIKITPFDDAAWTNRVAKLSELFNAYPELHGSNVNLQAFRGVSYYANSEGSVARTMDDLLQLAASARSQTADGMPIHDMVVFPAFEANSLPAEAELRRAFTQVAENVRSLVKAPIGESYSGPVLFDGIAAAQMVAQVVGDNLGVPRRPVSEPGRPAPPHMTSDLETKLGSRILPDWIDIADDATQTEWRGRPLVGAYPLDLEGVAPKPVQVVEKGVLKSFLTTRQPVVADGTSNGHARLAGNYGNRTAGITNLFVKASESKPAAALKAQLIDLVKQRGKPYGLMIRKLDYPTSATANELRAMFSGMSANTGGRPISPPVLVYRVYPDGREELVRGMRFRSLNSRSLRDILAASSESYVFDFVNNGAPFAYPAAGGYLAAATVVSPSLLFEDLELERSQDDLSKPPVVPPPPLAEPRP